MHKLIALQDIPSTTTIRKGDVFFEANELQAEEWIRSGMAKEPLTNGVQFADTPKSTPIIPALNSRGWDQLFWDGATVVIIASGPSLTAEQCQLVWEWRRSSPSSESRRVIAINTSFRLAPWADLLYACDGAWWDAKDTPGDDLTYREEALRNFSIDRLWTQDGPTAQKYGLRHIRSARARGLSTLPGLVHQGSSSGYQAMNLAYLAGAAKLILLGFDCKGDHWHGNHPAPLNSRLPHKQWIDAMGVLARDLESERVVVFNASPDTALTCFPRTPLELALGS
jgi:hypothetical protein